MGCNQYVAVMLSLRSSFILHLCLAPIITLNSVYLRAFVYYLDEIQLLIFLSSEEREFRKGIHRKLFKLPVDWL